MSVSEFDKPGALIMYFFIQRCGTRLAHVQCDLRRVGDEIDARSGDLELALNPPDKNDYLPGIWRLVTAKTLDRESIKVPPVFELRCVHQDRYSDFKDHNESGNFIFKLAHFLALR